MVTTKKKKPDINYSFGTADIDVEDIDEPARLRSEEELIRDPRVQVLEASESIDIDGIFSNKAPIIGKLIREGRHEEAGALARNLEDIARSSQIAKRNLLPEALLADQTSRTASSPFARQSGFELTKLPQFGGEKQSAIELDQTSRGERSDLLKLIEGKRTREGVEADRAKQLKLSRDTLALDAKRLRDNFDIAKRQFSLSKQRGFQADSVDQIQKVAVIGDALSKRYGDAILNTTDGEEKKRLQEQQNQVLKIMEGAILTLQPSLQKRKSKAKK